MHRYIISNTRSAADILEVWFLTRCALPGDETIDLDIVPLFETVDDLENTYGIMRRLYSHRIYQEHLSRRGNTQHIMLGFSDGTKDGGYVTANWEIYRTKQRLTELARGGGNTYTFYRALREHEKFLPYLERMTPLRFYGLTNIASRPTSRSSQDRLSLEPAQAEHPRILRLRLGPQRADRSRTSRSACAPLRAVAVLPHPR